MTNQRNYWVVHRVIPSAAANKQTSAVTNKITILGFPCNQFGQQEPKSNQKIQEFCTLNYRISFPIFDKTTVNGSETNQLYKKLKKAAPGLLGSQPIKWNFTKFLIEPSGKVTRFAPTVSPNKLNHVIQSCLNLDLAAVHY